MVVRRNRSKQPAVPIAGGAGTQESIVVTRKAEHVIRHALAWTRALAALVQDHKDQKTLLAAAKSANEAAQYALDELKELS
jgi:hypothetical protein